MINVHTPYTAPKASERIDDILYGIEEGESPLFSIPKIGELLKKQKVGIVLSCMYVHFDIQHDESQKVELSKSTIIKILFSEIGRALYDDADCYELGAFGNNIWGIYNTPLQSNLNTLLETSAKVASAIDLINMKIADKYYHVNAGIGMDYGQSIYINDYISLVNDESNHVWLGDKLENVSKISHELTKNGGVMEANHERRQIGITWTIYQNLKKEYQDFFVLDEGLQCYRSSLINVEISNWIKDNKNK